MSILHRVLYILGVQKYDTSFSIVESYAYAHAEREAMRLIDLFDALRIAEICAAGGDKAKELSDDYRSQINERAFRKHDPELERLEAIRNRSDEWEKQERWERRMRERRANKSGGNEGGESGDKNGGK